MPAVAPDLPTLLDFEGQFELAAQKVMQAAGVLSFIDQQADKLPIINTGIAADLGSAFDELTQLALPSTWDPNSAPPQEYFRYTLNLELRVEVPRDQNQPSPAPIVDTMLRTIRGQIRAAMLRIFFPFNDSNVPYYRVSDIRPSGTQTGFESARNVDFCALRYVITFTIQPTAWPAWTP